LRIPEILKALVYETDSLKKLSEYEEASSDLIIMLGTLS
jgi:hypothetical protein